MEGAPEESPNNGSHKELLGNGFHKGEGETLEESGDDNGQVKISGISGAEETGQSLASKLTIALKEIVTKDNLVRQHAKVAEDAISGWEKAEAEATSLKQQLENALQQKLALEERTAHLDGALKECVKQLRTGRDEQEQKHEEMAKNAQEWQMLRAELETKLTKAEATASESTTRAETLEQRLHSLAEAKTQAELESKKVSTRVEGLEKENSNLKHDVRALKKDLVSLNNESKKSSESSKQQLAESSRKVLKLEAECQKLKTQLRKRSTGNLNNKLEGEFFDRRKSLGRLVSSPRAFSVDDDCSEMSTREIDEKFFTMEEEVKVLRDEVMKKKKELEMARVLCYRTASMLSSVEDQLESVGLTKHIESLKAFGSNSGSLRFNVGDLNDEESDAWRKEETSKPDKLLDTTSFELMDDFLEMEKLTSNLPQENGLAREASTEILTRKEFEAEFTRKEKELGAANERIVELNEKVASLESRLSSEAELPCSNGDSHSKPEVDAGLISRVIRTIELLAEKLGLENDGEKITSAQESPIATRFLWKEASVSSGFESLVSSGNSLVEGGTEFISFSEEVAEFLEKLTGFQARGHRELERLEKEKEALASQVFALKAEKLELGEDSERSSGELEEMRVKARGMEMELAEKNTIIEQLRSSISAMEDDVNAAEERAHSTVRGLSETLGGDLEREKLEREAALKRIEAMNVVTAELQAQKTSLEEETKALVGRLSTLEEELKRERAERMAAQRDVDAVNGDIQKLMGEFVHLQHEKQSLEEALENSKLSSQAEFTDALGRLQEKLQSSLEREEMSKTRAEGLNVELERFAQREEALQRSVGEKDSRQIEMLVRIEKMKEEKAQLVARVEDLEERLARISEALRVEQGRVSGLREENNRLELQNVALEGRVSEGEEKLREMESGFRSLQDEFYQVKIEKEEVEQSFFMAEQNSEKLQARVASLEEENSRIQDGLKGEFDRSRAASSEKERLIVELEELKREAREAIAEVSSLRSSNDELQQKLNSSAIECTELDAEKRDLQHVLSATNEIVQGLKEECSRLAEAEEKMIVDKKALERDLAGAEKRLGLIAEELKAMEADKAELEHDLALTQVTWKSQVFEADELVASLRAELALSAKSRQLAEEQLAESFTAKAELQYQVKAAEHEASQVNEKVNSLEKELQSEREKAQVSEAEVSELRHRLESRVEDNNRVVSREAQAEVPDKSLELSAKLDECHRAILTLGEQLQALSSSRNSSPPSPTEPATSSEESTGTTTTTTKPDEEDLLVTTPNAGGSENDGVIEGKVFVPSLPLEGRPRSKSTSPAKAKISKSSSASKELDFSKSIDLSSSPSEKPSSSSGFSRFFRGKSSHH